MDQQFSHRTDDTVNALPLGRFDLPLGLPVGRSLLYRKNASRLLKRSGL